MLILGKKKACFKFDLGFDSSQLYWHLKVDFYIKLIKLSA